MDATAGKACRGLKSLAIRVAALLSLATGASAADLGTPAPPPAPSTLVPSAPAPWNWTGFYLGAHTGGALDVSSLSDPYGPTLFGDTVRSPGPLLGAQIGYDRQFGPWVVGGQADVTWANLNGTFTCLQPAHSLGRTLPPQNFPGFLGGAYGATCQAQPRWFGTVTGRAGLATGPFGNMLVYAKGGLAWMHGSIDIATNNIRAGTDGPDNVTTSSHFTELGWTAGIGLEYALGGHWSVVLEYDYLGFGPHSLATPNAPIMLGGSLPGVVGSSAPNGRAASLSQAIQTAKVGLNYRFGDRTAASPEIVAAGWMPAPSVANALEIEFGERYVHGWGRYQQDLAGTAPLPADNSRLTWNQLNSNGAELFARIDTPQNFVAKAIMGAGNGNGHMNDEDWGLPQPLEGPAVSVFPYQNSYSAASADISYFTVDAGYDWFRQPTYRFTPLIGYSYFEQDLATPKVLSYIMYSPPVAIETLGLGQKNFWRALRLGAAADVLVAPRVHLNAEAAYLPYVHYRGEDDHGPGALSPQWGNGDGVQLEAILSYDITDRLSVGLGGRYWAYWIAKGATANFSNGGTGTVAAQTFSAEQASLFVQAAYKFGLPSGGR